MMAHRFHDLFEPCDASYDRRKIKPINWMVNVGSGYSADIRFSSVTTLHIFISIIDNSEPKVIGRIGFCLDKPDIRYYFSPRYHSDGKELTDIIGWNEMFDDAAPFFDHMKENHQEVAEWLLWYI